MSQISSQLQKQLVPFLRKGDLELCQRTVADRLAKLPLSPFHIVLDLKVTSNPVDVADYFDGFFREQPRGLIAAAYTEMNGFEINPDLWFFSPFAYQKHGGHEDYDWLSNWQSGEFDDYAIDGLEPLQQVYANKAFREKRYDDASSVASLAVVLKFQDLIRRAVPHMRELRFPLLATAHDYDFIYEARPKSL